MRFHVRENHTFLNYHVDGLMVEFYEGFEVDELVKPAKNTQKPPKSELLSEKNP